ncbi:uncharacterized protein METZ01_LOCUS181826 [marine metagenome]|uniref:Uncharacterized protein n=1 Tax=marine metagenome TaxID=408172 RepID=A0A382CT06_9ZZZZ
MLIIFWLGVDNQQVTKYLEKTQQELLKKC